LINLNQSGKEEPTDFYKNKSNERAENYRKGAEGV
jgi:hypothetical protein